MIFIPLFFYLQSLCLCTVHCAQKNMQVKIQNYYSLLLKLGLYFQISFGSHQIYIFLKNNCMNRIKKLIDMEALSLKRLKLVVLDMQRDAKAFSLFTLPQVRLDTKVFSLTCLFWREIFLHRLENKERIWLGSHYNFSPISWRKAHPLIIAHEWVMRGGPLWLWIVFDEWLMREGVIKGTDQLLSGHFFFHLCGVYLGYYEAYKWIWEFFFQKSLTT